MRITIVQGAFLPAPPRLGGAVEKIWYALGREFSKRGHQVVHISRRWGDLPRRETDAGVEYRRVSGFNTPRSMVWLKVLDLLYSIRAVRTLPGADILVTNTFWLPILAGFLKDTGLIYVHVARFPKGQLRLYRRSARLQTVSHAAAKAMIAQAPELEAKVKVIANPLPDLAEVPAAISETSLNRETNLILYVGRVHPEKGIDLLLEAFARFQHLAQSQDRPGAGCAWRLEMVGPWDASAGGGGEAYRSQLLAQSERLGIKRDIEWVGPVYDAGKLTAFYRRATFFVYPSLAERGESFGLAPLEAMAQGCPPVVSSWSASLTSL